MQSKISILRNIQDKKQGGFVLENNLGETVAIVKKGKLKKYINQSSKSCVYNMKIDGKQYIIEPYIPLILTRFIIFLSAESGSGKTLMSFIFILQYMHHYKRRPVYYICNTKYTDDENLKSLKLQQLDTENIDEYKIEDFRDSLIVVDDTDFHPDHKKIMKFMNTVVECGRKFGISLIYSSHIHSKLSESPIYKEVSLYCTFPNALINNRMIDNNLKIPEEMINNLKEEKHAFICFNKVYRSIITDNIVSKY